MRFVAAENEHIRKLLGSRALAGGARLRSVAVVQVLHTGG